MNKLRPIALTLITALILLPVSSCGQSERSGDNWQKREDMAGHNASDPAMQAAIKKARKTLPDFWAAKAKNDDAYYSFSIKAGLKTSDDSLEHIWVADISRDGEKITGTLSNVPADLPNLNIGDEVSFSKDEVTDWQYVYDGKVYGHYTTAVLIKTMPPEQAEETRKMLGWDK